MRAPSIDRLATANLGHDNREAEFNSSRPLVDPVLNTRRDCSTSTGDGDVYLRKGGSHGKP